MDNPIQKGDLLFVYGNGFISHEVEKISHGSSHVAIISDTTTPYKTKIIESQALRGCESRDLLYYLNGNAKLEIYKDDTLTPSQRENMIKYGSHFFGDRYDYFLILLELLRFELGMSIGWYKEHDELICSCYAYILGKHEGKIWSKVRNPAPSDLQNGGVLRRKGILVKCDNEFGYELIPMESK